jgi:UDP-4-amino-4,6-dideoxy-N-acetyl-beta-L-altrosamine transaminase
MADTEPFLPYGKHCIEDDDIEAVAETLRSDFLTTGPKVEAFELRLAEITGAKHAIAVSNGTAALHLAAMALDLGPGDAVVVPTLTFLATANATRYVGAEVIFADVDPKTGLLTSDTLTDALKRGGSDVRAVFPVHLNGQTADMTAMTAVEGAADLAFVEDSCHALGGMQTTSGGTPAPVGCCADSAMTVFSLHPVKVVAMGEGGAITTNDSLLNDRIRRLRNIGMVREPDAFQVPIQAFDSEGEANPWYYEMPELGFNYRASAIHCALGLSQLSKLERFVATRNRLLGRYRNALAALSPLVEPLPVASNLETGWHLCVVHIDFESADTDRATVMNKLRENSIGTQVHYLPVHRQPYYRDRYGELSLPGADAYYESVLTLPLFVGMEDQDVDRVVAALGEALGA